jgi:hypothetical protein
VSKNAIEQNLSFALSNVGIPERNNGNDSSVSTPGDIS